MAGNIKSKSPRLFSVVVCRKECIFGYKIVSLILRTFGLILALCVPPPRFWQPLSEAESGLKGILQRNDPVKGVFIFAVLAEVSGAHELEPVTDLGVFQGRLGFGVLRSNQGVGIQVVVVEGVTFRIGFGICHIL